MGFRLGSFLGGMAEGAIEIEENVRKRNEKIIDTSLSTSLERDMRAWEKRQEELEKYTVFAKELKDYGLTDNQINIVLDYGPEKVKEFLATAPIKAKREGLDVGSYVTIMESADGNIPQYASVQERLERGDFIGVPKIIGPTRPELKKSPIIGRDDTGRFDSEASSLYSAAGIELPQGDQEELVLPKGGIKFMDLLGGGEGGEGLSVTRSGLNKSIAERLVPMSDANIEIRDDGSLVYDREQQAVASAINDIQTQTISTYNILANNDPVMAATNPERVYQIALESVIQDLPEDTAALFPRLNISSAPTAPTQSSNQPSTQPPATQSTAGANVNVRAQIDAIDNNAALTDAQKSAKKRAAIAAAGLAKTPQEADQILASGNY